MSEGPVRWTESEPAEDRDLSRAQRLVAAVEPLEGPSPAARARVHARLSTSGAPLHALDRAWRGWALTAAGAALAGLLALRASTPAREAAPRAPQAVAEVAEVAGSVDALLADGRAELGAAGQALGAGARLHTKDGARVRLTGLGELTLAPETELRLVPDGDDLRAEIVSGHAEAELAPGAPRRLVIVAGRWDTATHAPSEAGVERPATANGAEHRAEGRGEDRAQPRDEERAADRAGTDRGPRAPSVLDRARRTLRQEARRSAVQVDARAEPAIEAPRGPTAEELYQSANQEASPARAIELFDRVAGLGGPLAEVAGHQAARLVMKAGRTAEAIERFRTLIARHPESAYDEEARVNVLECHLALGDHEAAREDVAEFLARHPNSKRAGDLERLVRGLAAPPKKK